VVARREAFPAKYAKTIIHCRWRRKNFSYALPGVVLRGIEGVNRSASGNITISEQVTNPSTRDRYLINSLIEEAITSSQLEVEAPTPARRLIEVAALGHGAAVNAS
jgi:hypothetical protein